MMRYLFTLLFSLLLPFNATASSTEFVDLKESQIRLVSSVDSLQPESEFLIAAHIELAPNWHTYTYDPGDAGIPFSVTWEMPEGFVASETYWPPHKQYDEAGLTTYGFSDEVVFTYKITAPSSLPEATTINAKVGYLVCEEICIPQEAELTLTLPQGGGAPSLEADTLAEWHDKSKLASEWKTNKNDESQNASLQEQPKQDTNIEIYDSSIFTYIFFALLGGLILNLMPCVFPVLSLKALAIAKHAKHHPKEVRKHGVVYTLGILTCFWFLAGILIGIQQTGEAIGWGFQFQSPGFVAMMALLLFFIGLNLSGVFELPVLLGGLATKFEREDSTRGSYFTGLLAALVATPCTAPFMATAVGFALSQGALIAIVIFTFLGLGLALPFILISYFPKLLERIPKPGAWMEAFKNFLAFPMYLSAIWLLWILGTQAGMEGVIVTLIISTVIIFLIWAKGHCNFKSHFCTIANLLVIIALLFVLSDGLGRMQANQLTTVQMNNTHAVDFSPKKLAELRQENKAVFVNATASWCITCQVNYRVAINDQRVKQAFIDNDITYMVADWTNRNDEITNYLSSYGYKGVPLYVYYAPGEEGKVLPQLLTPGLILENIALPK